MTSDPNDPITLYVKAVERPAVARRLLARATDPQQVVSTSDGYIVPRWLAEAADMIVCEPAPTPAPPASSADTAADTAAGSGGDVEGDDPEQARAPRAKRGAGK